MSSNALKNELADHIYQYLCHEAQNSDLPEAARESLTAASECIEQAYKLKVNNNNKQTENSRSVSITSSSILPDELLKIFTRHKEFSGASTSGPTKSRGHRHHSIGVHQKKFKQKIIALIKKFRTDASNFDSEEQYRKALERELMKAAAGRGSRAIEELLEENIDVEGESASEPEDWDNISETSTPKPSLRPFFSSTTLDKI